MPVLSRQCEAWPLAIMKQQSSKANNPQTGNRKILNRIGEFMKQGNS